MTTATINGHSLAAGDGERTWIVGDTMTLKATGAGLTLLETRGRRSARARTGRLRVRAARDRPQLPQHRSGPSRILVGFTPGGMEGFFRDSGRPAVDAGPAPPVDADEIARTMAAAPRYGVRAVAFDDAA